MSSMVVKRRPFKVLFIFWNRKKSHGAMSGEYGGWGIVRVLFLAKNSRTSNEVWTGALSWRESHELFFYKSGRFFGLLHANGVELVGSTPYWPLISSREFMMHYAIKIEEHSEHNLHVRPQARMPPLGQLRLSFDVISHTLLHFVSFFTQNLIQILWSICFNKRKSSSS